ncbi:DUF429 domain-containing protein, partial [Kaarinaea lacus]
MQNVYMGVDGCRGGWLAIQLTETGDWIVELAQSDHALAALIECTQLTLIDIPIGLLDSGGPQRECDRLARKALTMPRAASVFSVPCRPAVYANTYSQASKLNHQLLGKKLSKQTWNITAKIRQIDELLKTKVHLRSKLRECHPELCFWAFNNKISMQHNKKLKAGREERMQVLMRFYPKAQHILDYSIEKFRRKQVAIDDIIDAMG